MKIKHLLIGMLAVATAVACKKDETIETPNLDVDKAAVEVAATAGEASFHVTSNQSWVASDDADWISIEPASGEASTEAVLVKITAEDNDTAETRKATVTVTAGELTKTVEVTQAAGEEIAILDGYQWICDFDDMSILFDLGIAEEGMLCVALPTMDQTGFGLYMAGFYEIEAADKSSGVISFTQYDWEWDEMGEEFEIQYSELTANSVKIVCENVFGVADPITFTRVESPYEIIPPDGGGDSPEGPIADGGYWFTNSGKAMAPMAEDATSGVLPANDLINQASTVKNTFTFTYDPDMSYYTIQDSYGRYLGNESWGEDISLTTELPTGEDYSYYLWCVDDSYGDGTVDVYNAITYNGFAYSSANNNWYLDPASYETDGIRPSLVPAENPVE